MKTVVRVLLVCGVILVGGCGSMVENYSVNVPAAKSRVLKKEDIPAFVRHKIQDKDPIWEIYKISKDYYDYTIRWDLPECIVILTGKGDLNKFDRATVRYTVK